VAGEVLAGGADAVERADVHADAAAVAIVGVDDGDGALVPLEDLRHVAPGVEDGLVRADHPAGSAVDAERGLDVVRLLGIAADRLGGAPLLARGAARAILGDDREGHTGGSLAEESAGGQAFQRCISRRISSSRPCSIRRSLRNACLKPTQVKKRTRTSMNTIG